MGIHLYCVVPQGTVPPAPLVGLEDRRVDVLDAGAVACWCSTHERPPQASAAALQRHNAVAAAAMTADVTPVPVRFGQWFAERDAAAAKAGDEGDRWLELLAAFAGRAEYGVRLALAERADAARDVHPAQVTSGKEYMAALVRRDAETARRRRESASLAAALGDRIGDLAVQTRVEAGAGALAVAHLVAWQDAETYRLRLREVLPGLGVRFTTSGPWPPWSFVA